MHRLARPAGQLLLLAFFCLSCVSTAASAQVMAHRGWAGAPITVVPWWHDAVFYQTTLDRLDSDGGQAGESADEPLLRHLDTLHNLGIDALILSPAPSATALERFDRLVTEASRLRLRVLVSLPLEAETVAASGGLEATARSWLGRGAGGFQLSGGDPLQVASLRRICASFVGERVLLGLPAMHAAGAILPDRRAQAGTGSRRRGHRSSSASAQLTLVDLPDESALAEGLDAPGERFLAALHDSGINFAPAPIERAEAAPARTIAPRLALLCLSRGAPLVSAPALLNPAPLDPPAPAPGSPPAPSAASVDDPVELTEWVRRLCALKHGELAIHAGELVPLHIAPSDAGSSRGVVGWLRRPAPGGRSAAPVLVVCNFSAETRIVSLTAELARLHALPGRGEARTLLRSGRGSGSTAPGSASAMNISAVNVGTISLEPFGVYAGTLGRSGATDAGSSAARSRRSGTISR